MSKEKYGVHISHCCYIHGCKYGDKDCPVVSGEVAQKHLCYDCTEEYEPYTLEEIELLRKTKSYRPTYKQLKDKVSELEAKLVEKETRITELEDKDWYEGTIKQLEEQCERLIIERDNAELKLTEKEKEIDKLKQRLKDTIKIYSDDFVEKDKELKELRFQARNIFPLVENLEDKVNQDKISFCIDKLSRVKNRINSFKYDEIKCLNKEDAIEDCLEAIDKQIEELKKEMK